MNHITSTKILINNYNAFIICYDNTCTCILLNHLNTQNNIVLSYKNNSFYQNFLGNHIPELNKNIIQYYNASEEQIFQYNTTMNYNIHQAIVHLFDNINSGNYNNFIEAIQHLSNYPMGQYNIQVLQGE